MSDNTPVIEFAEDIIANGYQVIPVDTEGVPCVKFRDLEFQYNERDAKLWTQDYSTASLAMHCGVNGVACLDVDIDDEVVAKELMTYIVRLCNRKMILRRRPGSPRFAVFFRFDPESTITKWYSARFITPANRKQIIELNNHGLVTVYGVHRKTKEEYQVTKKISPIVTPVEDLPLLNEEHIEEFFAYLCKIVPHNWVRSRGAYKSGQWQTDTWDTVTTVRMLPSEEEVNELLEKSDNEDYDSWLAVGMALHSYYNGSIEGMDKWDEWSSTAESYDGRSDIQRRWATFDSSGPRTAGTMLSRIRSEEREQKEREFKENYGDYKYEVIKVHPGSGNDNEIRLQNMLDNNVFIANNSLVADLTDKSNESIMHIGDWKNVMLKHTVNRNYTTPAGKEHNKDFPIVDIWMRDEEQKVAWDTIYVPGSPKLIDYSDDSLQSDGKTRGYYNVYCPPDVEYTEATDLLPMFFEHMKYIFPDGGHKWIFNWLAQMIQDPAVRYRCAPLSISTWHGTGRGWVCDLMQRLVGYSNYKSLTRITDISKDGAKTGWLDNSVLCVINEVYVKNKNDARFDLIQQLKTYLSDNIQEVDVKYGKQTYNQRIYTRIFMCSNHVDGLVIDDADTRIQPFINKKPPRDQEYYTELYELLDNKDFLDQVHSYLMRFKVNIDLLTHSQNTNDRKYVIKATTSKTALAIMEMRNLIGEKGVFTDALMYNYVDAFVKRYSENEQASVNLTQYAYLKKHIGQRTRDVTFNGKHSQAMSYGDISELHNEDIVSKIEETRKIINAAIDDFKNDTDFKEV